MKRKTSSASGARGSQFVHVDSVAIALADGPDTKAPVWIQIALQGIFKGHSSGEFSMTAQTFAEIVRNFREVDRGRVVVDFEHAAEAPASEGTIPTLGAPAQGWITDLEIRDGNLWACVEWGDLARQYIRAGQYRYCSPAIRFNARDPKSGTRIGARLSSLALTNVPFLRDLPQVAAKDAAETGEPEAPEAETPEPLDAVRDALELPDYATAEHVTAALGIVERDETATMSTISSAPARTRPRLTARLRDALRLPLSTPAAEVFAAARACAAVVDPAPATMSETSMQPTSPATPASHQESEMDVTAMKELEASNSKLTLRLSAAEAETAKLKADTDAAIRVLKDENAALKSEVEKRDARELDELIEATMTAHASQFASVKDARKHLRSFAMSDREGFVAMYPVAPAVPAAQAHLQQTIAAGPHTVPPPASAKIVNLREVQEDLPEIGDLVSKLMKETPSLSWEEAHVLAHAKLTKKFRKAASKAAGMGG